MATLTATIMALAPSQFSFRIPLEISLESEDFYTGPPRESTASSQHYTITAPEKSASSKPERRSRGVPIFPPRNNPAAYQAWIASDSEYDYENGDDNRDDEDEDENIYGGTMAVKSLGEAAKRIQ